MVIFLLSTSWSVATLLKWIIINGLCQPSWKTFRWFGLVWFWNIKFWCTIVVLEKLSCLNLFSSFGSILTLSTILWTNVLTHNNYLRKPFMHKLFSICWVLNFSHHKLHVFYSLFFFGKMLIWDNIWASISSSHLMFCQALSVQRGEAVKQVIIRVVMTTMMIVTDKWSRK